MAFTLSADQAMILESAQTFLADASPSTAVRKAMESPSGYDEAVWCTLAQELAWCATNIPEAHEGLGLGMVELALLMEQCGRHLLCAPFFSTAACAVSVLLESPETEACRHHLQEIASGRCAATVAWSDTGIDWDPAEVRPCAREDGHAYVVSGGYRYVIDAAVADLILVPVRIASGELALFAVSADTPGVMRTPLPTFDATRRLAALRLNQVRLGPEALVATGEVLDRIMTGARARAMIALAAEQLGGAQQCLDMTLAYIAERCQFGRSIASFQAVKHRCAEMLVRIEACRSTVYGAARAADGAPGLRTLTLEAAAAKSLASDAYFFCAQEAIQLHGGVGFTWEYDPQLHFKRAQATSHWFGTPDDLFETIAADCLDANRDDHEHH